jgi:uncharacterized protein (DUF1330 family)
MPAGYVIVEMKITDGEGYKSYMAAAAEAVRAAGGEYPVRGGRHEALEGDWLPARIGVLRFPSYEQAKGWYDGERYRAARVLREGRTEYFNMVLVEGTSSGA